MGILYVLKAEGTDLYKIGITSSTIEGRMKQLQTGCPHRLSLFLSFELETAIVEESFLHRRYDSVRVNGEWFRLSSDDVEDISERYRPRKKIYLAGRISTGSGRDWRNQLVTQRSSLLYDQPPDQLEQWPVVDNALPGDHSYTGPFFSIEQCTGHNLISPDPHGSYNDNHGCYVPYQRHVWRLNLDAIKRSDAVFAFIHDLQCFGTLYELGYAASIGKPRIVVLLHSQFLPHPDFERELWFCLQGADTHHVHNLASLRDVFSYHFVPRPSAISK